MLGTAQLVIYSIYKNKSTPKKSVKIIEDHDPATLVKGVVEMRAYDHGGEESGVNVKTTKSLSKGHSLPKPFLNRLYSMPQQIVKSLSMNSNQIDSTWVQPDDLENREADRLSA